MVKIHNGEKPVTIALSEKTFQVLDIIMIDIVMLLSHQDLISVGRLMRNYVVGILPPQNPRMENYIVGMNILHLGS